MGRFEEHYPSDTSYWRAIILFGRNVASYKFALGRTLLELGTAQRDFISLDELAGPFSAALAEHIARVDKQTTSSSSKFLDAVRAHNRGQLTETALRQATVRLGFQNVIDAFHIVGGGEVPVRFFHDERRGPGPKGIRLTDELLALAQDGSKQDLDAEVEARWRLVERAWQLNLSRRLIAVEFDPTNQLLHTLGGNQRRVDLTSCRDALGGYQKGVCFYCFRPISVVAGSLLLADIDHFFPFSLAPHSGLQSINGVWNLVLSCPRCNRGEDGKFARPPSLQLLERLDTRNEFLIASHHPLRETLMQQTGRTPKRRQAFLQRTYRAARELLGSPWTPTDPLAPVF